MALDLLLSSEDTTPIYEMCLKFYEVKNEYSSKGLEVPVSVGAARLGITKIEYSTLSNWIDEGGFESLTQNRVAEDFQKGAQFIQ